MDIVLIHNKKCKKVCEGLRYRIYHPLKISTEVCVCVCFRPVWVSPWWSVSGSDVEGFVFEASGPTAAGRALLHTGVEQVNTPHTHLWFYCRSERAVWWWLDVTVCVRSEKRIRYDHYLIPFTLYELGLLYKQQGDYVKATRIIEDAKWVHFIRVHVPPEINDIA